MLTSYSYNKHVSFTHRVDGRDAVFGGGLRLDFEGGVGGGAAVRRRNADAERARGASGVVAEDGRAAEAEKGCHYIMAWPGGEARLASNDLALQYFPSRAAAGNE